MNEAAVLTHASVVDAEGFVSSQCARRSWHDLDLDPVAGKVRWGAVFESANQGFRRLDRTSKLFAFAAEMSGLDGLPDSLRQNTALVLASSTGCLAADLRFEQSLHVDKGIEPAVFPYTLPSTVLGEISIRHRLRGPTLCMAVASGEECEGLSTALALIAGGEAEAALVLLGDWLVPERAAQAQIAAKTQIVALLLQARRPDTQAFVELADASTSTMRVLTQALHA